MLKLSENLSKTLFFVLSILQFLLIAVANHYSKIAGSLFDYKTGATGDTNLAEPYQHLSNIFFCFWLSTLVLAVFLGAISPAKQRTVIFLLPVLIFPALEFMYVLITSFQA
ncbi:MAG: hypothetical protein ACAH07_06140 [Methylophilaceae bacterium]|nr:hypothetical protein [Methyloradius sp.]